MLRRFQQIDVFGDEPYYGNPLSVVLDAEGLSAKEMQCFTRWANLSECAFLLPPTSHAADYRVRIFTLTRELPFAGHPTLGSCHAWLTAGGRPQERDTVTQECPAGLVSIRTGAGHLAFAAPPLVRSGPVEQGFADEVAHVLGLDPKEIVAFQWVANGPGWIGVLLKDAQAVLSVEPDFSRYQSAGDLDIGLVGPYPTGEECAFEIRAVFSDEQRVMREDPVTGSLNASLAQWLLATGRAKAPYTASQGTRLGRRGRAHVTQDADGAVWVGGATTTCIQGTIDM